MADDTGDAGFSMTISGDELAAAVKGRLLADPGFLSKLADLLRPAMIQQFKSMGTAGGFGPYAGS